MINGSVSESRNQNCSQSKDKYIGSLAEILFALRQKSEFGQIRNPRAVSRCSKYLFLLSEIYFPVASTAYLRQKGQAQQIIGEITRDFEGVRVSQLEATFFEVLLHLANSIFCISVKLQLNCARLKTVNQDAEPLDVGVPLQRK